MRFILVSAEDPTVKQTVDIPKELVTGYNPQPAVTKPTEPPTEPQKTLHKKSHQSSKPIIHG